MAWPSRPKEPQYSVPKGVATVVARHRGICSLDLGASWYTLCSIHMRHTHQSRRTIMCKRQTIPPQSYPQTQGPLRSRLYVWRLFWRDLHSDSGPIAHCCYQKLCNLRCIDRLMPPFTANVAAFNPQVRPLRPLRTEFSIAKVFIGVFSDDITL